MIKAATPRIRAISFAGALLLVLAAAPVSPVPLFADDGDGPAKKGAEQPADPAPEPDRTGELFPGVRGISVEELARRIAEHEKRKKDAEKYKPRTPATPAPADTRPASQPASQPGPRETPSADPQKKPPVLAMDSLASLSAEARDFFKDLDARVTRLELLLEKAREIRAEAEAEARKIGHEERIQYYLRYTEAATRETRAYENTLMFPVVLYRYIYERANDAIQFAVDRRPKDLPANAADFADRQTARLKEVRRQCLLAAAELFTRMRKLPAAEHIYLALLKEFPADKAVKRSYDDFVRIRDEPKPSGPPVERQTKYERDILEKDPDTGERVEPDYSKWRR